MKNTFRIFALDPALVAAARATRRDVAGNALVVVRDGERHQCRHCLHLSHADEAVLLMAHQPFSSRQPYAETGPVFIHERDCDTYADVRTYPGEFPRHEVVLRAYSQDERIIGAHAVNEQRVEDVIDALFADEAIAFLHARNLAYGCYMFRIERA